MTNVPFLIDQTGKGQIQIFAIFGENRAIFKEESNNLYFLNLYSIKVNFQDEINGFNGPFNLIGKHFASNVDFNGDCEADLFMLSKKDDKLQF